MSELEQYAGFDGLFIICMQHKYTDIYKEALKEALRENNKLKQTYIIQHFNISLDNIS